MKVIFVAFLFLRVQQLSAQTPLDTNFVGKKLITLSAVVVDNKLDVAAFIKKIEQDSSFYKAFKNLRILGYTAFNDVRMLNKKGNVQASLNSKTKQSVAGGCRTMEVLEETTFGDMYDEDGAFNYYTANMYASLFFTKGKVCGETNVVTGTQLDASNKGGMDKRKEQLKILFFNPGRRITGIPFISNKTAIYDDEMADKYDMGIDLDLYNSTYCYIFTQTVKPNKKSSVVVDKMITWFNQETMEVVARKYTLKYDAGIYDLDVDMEVQMKRFNNLTVPALIRYTGNWKVVSKKRERGIFTATLHDFGN